MRLIKGFFMKVIIVGCGKVGKNIAKELAKEKHDVVVIDRHQNIVESTSNSIDAIGVVGEGASLSILQEAGIESSDVLIAVTNADEVNLLCCLFAKKANPNVKTIARVRNPMYSSEINYIKDELGLTMAINPEMITAREISRLIRWPSALKVDSFLRGKIELISFAVNGNKKLVNKSIAQIKKMHNDDILFVGIERKGEAIIPKGDTVILDGDKVSVCGTPSVTTNFLNRIDIYESPIKNCLIVGGSNTAFYLAKILEKSNIDVAIMDMDPKRCDYLAEELPEASIINSCASDDNVLIEEGLPECDSFVSLTGIDEENVLLSLYAKSVSKAKVITKVNHISYDGVLNNMDVGALVSPKNITANNIVAYIRGLANSGENEVETMHRILSDKAEALTFEIKEKTKSIGSSLESLKTKDNLLICLIVRGNKLIIPSGKDTMEIGDTVLVVTTHQGLNTIEDIIR